MQRNRNASLKVVVDAVNSTGGIAISELLEALGVECVNCIVSQQDIFHIIQALSRTLNGNIFFSCC